MPIETSRARHSPLRRFVAWTGGLLLLLLLVLVGLFTVGANAVAARVRDRAVPLIEQRLGRDVSIGPVEARVFPSPRAVVTEVRVAGGPGEPAMLESGRALAQVELWPLLRSLGREVRVSDVELRDTTFTAVKRKDGTWSHDEVLARLEQGAGPQAQAGSSADVVVREARIRNGTVRLVDRSLPGDPSASLSHLDVTARELGLGHPLALEFSAALVGTEPNLRGRLDVDPLPRELTGLAPRDWPTLTGKLTLAGVPVERLEGFLSPETAALISGGRFGMDANVSTTAERTYVVAGQAKLEQLQVRNQPADGSFRFDVRVPAGATERAAATLDGIALEGPGIDLGGKVTVTEGWKRVRFALTGQKLDVDALMAAMPPEEEAAQDAGLVPPEYRARVRALDVAGTLAFQQVVSGKLTAQNLTSEATMRNGELVLDKARADVYGGKAELDGTRVRVTDAVPRWSLKSALQGLDLGAALAQLSGHQAVTGKANLALELTGQGSDWNAVRPRLTGEGGMLMQHGALAADLGGKLAGALAQALRRLGKEGAAQGAEQRAQSPLEDLSATFAVKQGWVALERPLTFTSSFGTMALGGRVGLDQRLDLAGSVLLTPGFVARATGGRFKPGGPVSLPLQVGGSLQAPALTELDTAQLARQLVASSGAGRAAQQRANQVKDKAQQEVKKKLGDLLNRF